jgi:hypothetical protein
MSLGMKAVAAAQENGSLRQRLETGGCCREGSESGRRWTVNVMCI